METIEMNERRPITINPNLKKGELKVLNRSNTNKYSWFLTDTDGNIHRSGCEKTKEVTIDINDIEEGVYRFRAQGEVFEFNVGIAS